MSSDEVVSVVQVKKDDVDDDKSVISSSMTTSTYDTAHDDEEDATETHREDVTANGATDNVENGVGGPEDTNDHEDEDGQLSDDQKSNGSSIAGSSAGSQVPDVEREEGDGQEEGDKKDKKLDHDEDRRDPQYIPKRGVFYEHDDRTLDDDPEDKKEPVREPKKSKAFEAVERWGHDMYNDDEQSPKTTEELVDMYGYDIRKEEAPPKARRRRRYGKGPNKYERSWEDERAYNKTPTRGGFKGQKRPPRNFVQRDEDFPALGPKTDEIGVSAGPPTGDATHTPQRNDSPRSEIKFSPKPPPVDEISLAKEEIKHYSKGPMGDRGVDGGRPSRSEAVRGRAPLPRRGRTSHDQLPPFAGKNHHGDRPDKHGKGASTADEDIATLAQHFSNAVINVDRNIAPIRSTSEPPAEDRPQRETRREDGTKHQGHHHNHHNKHGGEKLHHSEKHHGGPPLTDKHHQPPDQPSTKSKRYSTQRQRPAQHMNSGAQPQNSAPPAPPAQTAPGYLPPPQGYYPPQHGMCPPEGTPHMSAPPPAQFPPPPGGMQMVTFLPGVPPPPTNTFHPPPNVYVPPTSYIPPPPLVQPIQASELKGEENERILEEEIGKENVGSVRTDEETSNVKEKPEPTRRGARRGHPVEVASSAPVSGDNGGDRVGADVQPEKDLDNVEVSKSDDESSKKKEKVPPKRGARRAVQKNDAGNLPVQKEQKPSEQVATETALVSLENNEVITQNVEEPIDNPVEEVELVKAASKKALSKNPKKANNIKASELKGEENERILEEEIGKENVGSVRTDEETSNVKEKPEPTRRGARRGHPVEVASSAPVSGDNGGDRVGADVQPEKDLDNVEVSKSDDESSKKKEKVPPKRGARRAVQKNDAGNLPVQKEQKPSEQVATETALVSLENNEVITQNVEEPIDNPVEEVELVKAASKKALSKNPKKANNIKASELKGEENERILEEEIGKENVGSVRTDEETSNVKEKPEPTRRGARRGHPVEVASSAPVSGDNGGDRVGADVQPEKDLDNVEVSKSDDESSKKKEKVPPKRGARRAVQKNDAGNLPVQKEQKPSEQVATETALVSLENNEVITQNVEEPIDNPVEEVELVKAASKKALSKNPKKANNIKASELKGEENERILEEEIGKENVGSVRTDEETSNVKEKPEPTRRGARRGHPVEVASSAPVSGDNGGDRVGADVQPEKDLDNVEVSKSDDESSKKKEKVPPKRGARRAVQKNDAGNLPVQKEQKPSEQVATETALVSLENNEVITQNVEEPIDNPVEEVELVKAASKKALSKNPKKANNIKASELKGEENERILEEEIGKENVGSVRTDEETSNVKEKPEPTRRGARRGHPVEVASSAPVSGDNGGDRVGADVQPEKDLDNVEVSKSDDESSKKKEKVPPKRGARRAVQKNDAGNLPVQKEQKPSEQVATETALVSLENNEVITQNVEEPIDNPVEEVELVKAASKKALSKNPKKANNIKASELKGEENERILEEEIGKENVGSVRTDEETSNVKEKPEPTRRGARRGHPVEVASSAPVSGDNGGDRVGADVQPEKDLDNVEVSKSDDESSKKKEKVPPKRGARRAVQKNDAGNL